MNNIANTGGDETQKQNCLIWFILLISPFFLNDLAYIFINDYRLWLAVDYLTKIIPLIILIYLLRSGKFDFADLGLKMPGLLQLVFWTILTTILAIAMDQFGWRFFEKILPDTKLSDYPEIPVYWLRQFDLYFGLLFVGIMEEVVFRGFAYTVLRKYLKSTVLIISVSSLIFGLIHWSIGLHAIVNTAFIGFFFMTAMWRTGSVIPLITAHFISNYVSFSGMIPSDSPWFDFLQ